MRKQGVAAALVLLLLAVFLAGCAARGGDGEIRSLADLSGKQAAVLSGSRLDTLLWEAVPDCAVEYVNAETDGAVLLETGKVDALVVDEPIFAAMHTQYPSQRVLAKLQKESYGAAFPKNQEGEALCAQMNEFLAACRADGTLETLRQIWLSADESKKVVDLSGCTGENGTLEIGLDGVSNPFNYIKDNQYAGYEVDMIARFCAAYGYKPSFSTYDFSGLLTSVSTGRLQMAISCMAITEERKKSICFSEPYYEGGVVVVIRGEEETQPTTSAVSSVESLAGKKIAVMTGTVFDGYAEAYIPGCQIQYTASNTDSAAMLENGKVSGYVTDQPTFRCMAQKYPDHILLQTLAPSDYAFIFNKDTGKALCAQMNEFLKTIREDGTLAQIDSIWFGTDENLQVVDFPGPVGENGTLRFACCTSIGAPFAYLSGGAYAGYDLDILARFCRAYGYGLEISDLEFAGVLSGIAAGKFDLAADCIAITEERKKSVLFSDPDYTGGVVLVVKAERLPAFASAEELRGKPIAVMTGSIFDRLAEEKIPGCKVQYAPGVPDSAALLESGKVSAYIADQPSLRYIAREYPDHVVLETLAPCDYAFIFNKDTGKALCAQMNEFLGKIREDGTLAQIDSIWFGTDESQQVVDFPGPVGENGTLRFACSTAVGAPFAYLSNGAYAGYDLDVLARFCSAYGYGLEISDLEFAGVLAGITGGKFDLAADCIAITEERKRSVLFSDPDYTGGIVLVVKAVSTASDENAGLWDTVCAAASKTAASFTNTFIRESRWKLFLSGIGRTLLIAVLSVLFGTLLGFGVYLVGRKLRFVRTFTDRLNSILEKTPVVVILMMFYYILFGKSDLDGMWVAVIGFTLLFCGSVIGLLRVGVSAVDTGQTEAGLALGYTERQTFIRIVFPQALRFILPGYKSAIVSLVKDTAIVGYIAVQDLTKVGDIVRSRTYEAFFPLIATAVIYFGLACLLIALIRHIELSADPKRRRPETILKGVKTK